MARMTEYKMRSQADGLNVSVLEIAPEGEPGAVLQMAHGMAEHKERYIPMMQALAGRGYVCVMNDHRGHGKSVAWEQDLGYFGKEGARYLVEDMHQLTGLLKEKYPGLPVYLYGHSMGSLAARVYRSLYEADIDGLVLCGSPGRNPGADAAIRIVSALTAVRGANYRSWLVEKMSSGMAGKYAAEGSKFAWLSTDKAEVQKYEDDPLCGFRFTLNGYKALFKLLSAAYMSAPAKKPEMPVHFIAGADDPCLPDEKGFADAVAALRADGYRNVTQKLYPGMRHEIHNEKGREQVWADLADVLDQWNG